MRKQQYIATVACLVAGVIGFVSVYATDKGKERREAEQKIAETTQQETPASYEVKPRTTVEDATKKAEEQAIGIWGQRHLDYLKQYRKVTYTNLLTSGRLNAYLADINRQAQERFERLIEGMKQAQGITEQLKAENALEWTGCLNNIRACAREIVEKEIIFA